MKKLFLLIYVPFIFVLFGCKNNSTVFELPRPVGSPTTAFFEPSLISQVEPSSLITELSQDNLSTVLTLNLSKSNVEFTPKVLTGDEQSKVLGKYAKFKGVPEYELLNSNFYTISASEVSVGGTQSDITVSISDYSNIPFGTYYIPVLLEVGGTKLVHFVSIFKDGDYASLSENPKPLPPSGSRAKPMKMIAFVETNDWDPRNMSQFILKETHQPVFDMIVFFAPNMNYDSSKGKRYLFFNDKLQPIVKNPDTYIKPITDRGVKVIFEILPNHQGVGYENFQSYEEALEFAKEVKFWTDKLGIDGWDIDEEYAKYYKRPELPVNNPSQSVLWYMRAMKEVMPNKLLTLYEYGLVSRIPDDEFGKNVKDYVDFSFADYGVGEYGSEYGLDKLNYAGYSIEANRGGLGGVQRNAQRVLDKGYGGLMIFGMRGDQIRSGEAERELSKATQLFYGQDCVFSGAYHKGPRDL